MKEISILWANENNIKDPLYGFHIWPENSLITCHNHCLDIDEEETSYIDDNKKIYLPGYDKHIDKTVELDNIIANLLP